MADRPDELFTVVPAEFVAARNALAKRLRAEGQRAEATAVSQLRRPSAALWALNQLARVEPDAVEELLDAGAELAAAQEALLGGDQARFRTAVARHRHVLGTLAERGARLVAERDVSATDQRQEIADELRAASTVADVAELLRRGQLPDAPSALADSGSALGGLGVVSPPTRGEDQRGAGDDEARRRAAEVLAARREERAAAVDDARRTRDRVADERQESADDVRSLEASLDRARRRLEDADRRLADADDALADAESELGELDRS